jgi:hypothetical protein
MKTGLLNKNLVGKHAFTAVVVPEGFIIGRADYGIRGYTPIKVGGFDFKTYDEAKQFADEQNKSIGLTKDQALEIVFNTM